MPVHASVNPIAQLHVVKTTKYLWVKKFKSILQLEFELYYNWKWKFPECNRAGVNGASTKMKWSENWNSQPLFGTSALFSVEDFTFGKSVVAIFSHFTMSELQGSASILYITHMHILKGFLEARGIPQPLNNHKHWLTTPLHVPHFPIEGDKRNL